MRKPGRAGAALIGLFGAVAGATTLLAMDVPALAKGSDVIVRGTVSRMTSRWTYDRQRIITEVDLEVAETFKGVVPSSVTVVQPGGVVDDIGQTVSGLASFSQGEEVVVFLERRPGDSFLVSGMAQGKYRVERSSDGRSAYAVPDSPGDALLLDPRTREPVRQQPARPPPTLDELVAQIRLATQRPASAPGPTGRKPIEKVP